MRDGYRTGRGRVVMRATCHFEDVGREGGKQAIIIDELPYQVNKANLLIKIGELVREKQIDGISDLRDESDKSGMRVYIELKRGENADVVLNNLYKQTQMQDTFGMNMVALIEGQPRLLNLTRNARRLPAPPARSRHPPHRVRSAQGARTRPYPGRSGGGAGQRRRDRRTDQDV